MSTEGSMVGVPDPEAEYFARIQFGRSEDKEKGKTKKLYLDFHYPNLPYGAMVGIQKMLSEGALQDLVLQGELVAEMMGQPVLGIDEIKAMLEDLRKQNAAARGARK